MTNLLARLSSPSEIYEVEGADVGFSIIAKPERVDDFSAMVQQALNCPNPPFILFATPLNDALDGRYESAHVLPL